MAWLSGWSYRKEISITGQSGAGTNYQVKHIIGDSAGGDFHLEGHCTNFPQDIEVTDNDGATLLKFWIEDITADPLKMWTKVADDLGSNQTIYIYYGKSGATTNSNGTDTFELYHDGPITTTHQSTATFGTGYAVRVRSSNPNADSAAKYLAGWGDQISITRWIFYRTGDYTGFKWAKEEYDGGITTTNLGVVADTNYHIWDIGKITGTAYYNRDGNDDGSLLTGAIADADRVVNYSDDTVIDWYAVRKYVVTEPAFSSAGSEETPPTGVSPTAVFYGPLVGPLGGPI